MAHKQKMVMVSGKRKTAIAKARIREGSGNIYYNGLPHTKLQPFHKLALSEPMRIASQVLGKTGFDVEVSATGGGRESQIQAARLAIAKAIVAYTKSADLRKAYTDYDRHLLVADTRRKEAYKPDDSKARAKRQSSKR